MEEYGIESSTNSSEGYWWVECLGVRYANAASATSFTQDGTVLPFFYSNWTSIRVLDLTNKIRTLLQGLCFHHSYSQENLINRPLKLYKVWYHHILVFCWDIYWFWAFCSYNKWSNNDLHCLSSTSIVR